MRLEKKNVVCSNCGAEFQIDSRKASFTCPRCRTENLLVSQIGILPIDETGKAEKLKTLSESLKPKSETATGVFTEPDAHSKGDGKTPYELVDVEFLGAMARQLAAGDRAHAIGWRQLDPAHHLAKYRAAILRHFESSGAGGLGAVDNTGETHYAAIAVNAMICAFFERRLKTSLSPPSGSAFTELSRLWDMTDSRTRESILKFIESVLNRPAKGPAPADV